VRIKKLTSAQEARLPEYRDRWLKIGLSKEPLDFEPARKAVILSYKLAGLKPPENFYCFQSPLSAAMGIAILRGGDQVREQVRNQVWDQVGEQVRVQVGEQVRDQVREQVWDQVRVQVRDQVREQVREQVRKQVRDSVRDPVGDQVWVQVWDQVFGNHDASWLGFYEFFRNELNIKACERIDGLIELSKHCGWWIPYNNAVVLQDRPCEIHWDAQNRLHNEAGMSIKYRDGFGVHSWHGTRIPGDWLDGKTLTPKIALTHRNIEQRRAACEILTWEVMLRELDAVTIEKDSDPMIGELLEVDIPDIGREKFLRVLCGTGRTFAIPMPPHIQTALEGNAWSYNLDGDTLKKLEFRT